MLLTLAELRTLDRLLQSALDLPEPERRGWIDSLPRDESRFAAILREHLPPAAAARVETNDFLGTLPKLAGDWSNAGEAFPDAQAGERVGPYCLSRKLGEGGMSSVWLAERVDGELRREVALKLPHRHLLDRGLAERMRRERDILAALNHDHIARLYDAGVDAQGRPYLALEYVVGTPIDAYCAEHKLDLEGRVRLLAQVARAVAHAHANLAVHRDLKPRNILVTVADGAPAVKLLDFGIAKLLASGAAADAADLTASLGRALTPDYASPEQVLEQPLTTATDVYSLGVVMYEVVTGEKPYRLKRQSAAALAEAIVHADIARPSARVAARGERRAARRIAGDLDAVILKALRLDPRERYASASALAEDLERFLAHQPVQAQPDSWRYRAGRFIRRNAIAAGAATAIALALLVGTGLALWKAREARTEAAKTRAVKDFLLGVLSAGVVGHEAAAARSKKPVGDVLVEAAKSLPADLDAHPDVKSEVQETLGNLLENMLLSQAAAGVREARLRDLESRGEPLIARVQAKNELAYSLGGAGRKEQAVALFDEVIAALDSPGDLAARNALAFALTNRAMLRNQIADGAGAVADAERAVRLMESGNPGSNSHVYTLIALGASHAAVNQWAEADAAFARALPLARALPGSDAAIEATAHSHLARSYFQRRDYARAEEHATGALRVIERFSSRESFHWARNAVYPGAIHGLRGDMPGARQYLEQAVRIFAGFGADVSPEYASLSRVMLAQAVLRNGDPAEAARIAGEAHAPYRDPAAAAAHPLPAIRSRNVLAEALQVQGRHREADALLAESAALGAKVADRQAAPVYEARRLAAQGLAYSGDHAAAERALKALIADNPQRSERFGAPVHHARIALAQVYVDAGRHDAAAEEITAIEGLLAGLAPADAAAAYVETAQVARLRGRLMLRQVRAADALPHLRRAVEILEPRQHPQSPFLAAARAELARALPSSGRPPTR